MKLPIKTFAFVLALSTIPAVTEAKDITLNVSGMTCDFCAQGITKKLKAEAGVTDVKVDLTAKVVLVKMKDESDISDDRFKKLITDSGFELKSVDRSK